MPISITPSQASQAAALIKEKDPAIRKIAGIILKRWQVQTEKVKGSSRKS